ncbi:hypothetical protein [Pyxidicoccus sp. MSG2]|uniref:hypothetical protein n=1 Tax=Pyxidicoccus sp. MSG2 TaxID=2996790 RepID=UPI00226F9436|nr:hypothetical protein [Pyxidicoccus sp. MSG2]MCY1019464.1 hypothetical protein [Pyxidicoccus sp. MSG2]
MKKHALLLMVAAALVGCGGVEGSPELEGQEEVVTLPDGSLTDGEGLTPAIQEDEAGRVTASGVNCQVGLVSCSGTTHCINNGQCTSFQASLACVALFNQFC